MNTFTNAMKSQTAWSKTWNGADCLKTTLNSCLDMFGRSGALRQVSVSDKQNIFRKAFEENSDIAMKLLFYTRDIRGGLGERKTFRTILQH